MVEAGAPGDSHDPPGMLGSPPDNLLDSPPSLCPEDWLWEGKQDRTRTLTEMVWEGRVTDLLFSSSAICHI